MVRWDQFQRAQPPWVHVQEQAPVIQREHRARVRRKLPAGRYRIQPAGHSKVHDQRPATAEAQDQGLAVPVDLKNPRPCERVANGARLGAD